MPALLSPSATGPRAVLVGAAAAGVILVSAGAAPASAAEAGTVPIAEIQGSAGSSPLEGETVSTTGVVTAHYGSGGLDGYVIQTPGTGGDGDGERTASDAVFVYAPNAADEVSAGDTVEVTGEVTEYYGLTEVSVRPGDAVVVEDGDPVEPLEVSWPTTDAEREALESMLVAPEGEFTVSDTYATNQYGEVGLAAGTTPLVQPTDVAAPGSEEAAAIEADNAARGVVLDDGASTDFLSSSNSSLTPPYVSTEEPVRVGASASFTEPVIVDFRHDAWRFNPTEPVTGDGSGEDGVVFEDTRTAEPEPVRGDVSVASFNVLNYFTTLGADTADCEAYTDREGDGVAVRRGCDPRGAWDRADLQRQQDKIVSAINGLDAGVVGLMEIENSARLREETDEALAALTAALNADAGEAKWAFVPSPQNLPDAAQLDVIRNALIYQPGEVEPVGDSVALAAESGEDGAFVNAREPIAQAFDPADGGEPFVVAVNHFKSKGSAGPWPGDEDTGDGQGYSNESRMRQATALAEWIETDPTGTGTESVLLVGDFNAYTQEDPMRVLYDAGYTDAASTIGDGESSYVFQGLSGSLDHVLMNDAARQRATGSDTWSINAGEAVALEYSRYNYHGTLLFEPGSPFRSSDHDPVVVGLSAGESAERVASDTRLSTVPPGHVKKGELNMLTASVTVADGRQATGEVEFFAEGESIGAVALTAGTAALPVPDDWERGPHHVTATFTPDTVEVDGSESTQRTVVVK